MQIDPGDLATFSSSSRTAFRWAKALAQYRAERDGRSSLGVAVDAYDLLVGIMLAHPADSEPRQLLAHIGASVVEVLPPSFPIPESRLDDYSRDLSPNEALQFADALTSVIPQAMASPRGGGDVVELRALFGALLTGTNEVAAAFHALLARAGLSGVDSSYEKYLHEPSEKSYTDFLQTNHPFKATPLQLPAYKADGASVGDDLIDIRAEVDAFAYLLASRSLTPPLAVGLFGDWGVGKSFFMDSLRARIVQLMAGGDAQATPQSQLPFWKRIVQIEFNAWHYVKGDLWASLVDHLFSELRMVGDKGDTELEKRQKYWLEAIDEKRRQRAGMSDDLADKVKDKKDAEASLGEARSTKDAEEKKLEEARVGQLKDVVLTHSISEVKDALIGAADRVTEGNAGQTLAAIHDARDQLHRASGVVGTYPWTRKTTVYCLSAIVLLPALVFGLGEVPGVSASTQTFAGITTVLGACSWLLRAFSRHAAAQLDKLDKAEAAVNREVAERRRLLEEEVRRGAAALAEADARVSDLLGRSDSLDLEIAGMEALARTLTSSQILGDFVAERVGSSDYRKLLGTAALVHRDFAELSSLIEDQNEQFISLDKGDPPPEPHIFNRIILYIDDLDRCEPDRVIEVLQAVHLLLAFPLFVVVVAVDSRWLAQALEEHYPALAHGVTSPGLVDPTTIGEATSSDYLEKIFQIPFWVNPLTQSERQSLMRGLLQGSLVLPTLHRTDVSPVEPLTFSDESERMVQAMFKADRVFHVETASLSVSPAELAYLDALAPLLGDTPRSIKRFVNVYQLMCAMPAPPSVPDSSKYRELVGSLLALRQGLPTLWTSLQNRAAPTDAGETLSDAIAGLRASVPEAELARYDAWVTGGSGFAATSTAQAVPVAALVQRFSFR